MAEAPANEVVRSALRLRRQVISSFIETFLEARIAAGVMAEGAPVAAISRAIAMLLDGVVVEWAVSGPELDLDEVRAAILALVTALTSAAAHPASPATESA
jgi:AcrR family transcriptional regulator